jgi:enoyl-CoA hydratase
MVSKIFPAAKLEEETLNFARRIAQLPSVTSLLVKESVNQSVDNMGFFTALNACFTLHQLNHAHWSEVTKGQRAAGTPEWGIPDWRTAPAVRPAEKTRV